MRVTVMRRYYAICFIAIRPKALACAKGSPPDVTRL
jgi:hypothetical protein